MTPTEARRERQGFLVISAFILVASVRDVYFAGMFGVLSPLLVAGIAFGLGTLVFLAISLLARPAGLRRALAAPADLVGINVTSAIAWICYLLALARLEPSLLQIVWAGVGPLTVRALSRAGARMAGPVEVGRGERVCQAGIAVSVVLAMVVSVLGLSGTGNRPAGETALSVALALVSGVAITVNTLLCKRLNERDVPAEAVLSVRFIGVALVALPAALVLAPPATVSLQAVTGVAATSLLLIVLPLYASQVGIALASPLTVRAVYAAGPVVVFVLQWLDGRLAPSGWSAVAIALYSVSALLAAAARRAAVGDRPPRYTATRGGSPPSSTRHEEITPWSTRSNMLPPSSTASSPTRPDPTAGARSARSCRTS